MELTPAVINELKSLLVERIVDNMSTKDLVQYVTDDLDDMYKNMSMTITNILDSIPMKLK